MIASLPCAEIAGLSQPLPKTHNPAPLGAALLNLIAEARESHADMASVTTGDKAVVFLSGPNTRNYMAALDAVTRAHTEGKLTTLALTPAQMVTLRSALRWAIDCTRSVINSTNPPTDAIDQLHHTVAAAEIREYGELYNALFPRRPSNGNS